MAPDPLDPTLALARLLAAGTALAAGAFAGAYALYRRRGDASVVDAAWSFTMGGTGVLYAALGAGDARRRAALALMAGAWGLRLGLHLVRRIRSGPEDARYEALRDGWRAEGHDVHRRMARFYAGQAVSVVVLSLPFALAAREAAPIRDAALASAALLFAVAFAGEAAADAQLRRFKADPAHRGQVCDRGLWAWSRHPNYFFEWLTWLAFAALALDARAGWLGLLSPALMLYVLLRVTGIPLTEARMLASRGARYRAYQRRVARFVPRPPRRHA